MYCNTMVPSYSAQCLLVSTQSPSVTSFTAWLSAHAQGVHFPALFTPTILIHEH